MSLSKKLRAWVLEKGWAVERNKAYGDYGGYTFTAFEGPGFVAFALPVPAWPGNARTGIGESLKKRLKRIEVLADDRALLVKLRESFRRAKTGSSSASGGGTRPWRDSWPCSDSSPFSHN